MRLLDILFPHSCIYCGKYKKTNEFGLCNECCTSLPMKLFKKGSTFYLFEYDKKISTLLKISKYAGRPYYIKMLASLLGQLLVDKNLEFDAVAYVPMHKKSFSIRGYNQSRIAARELASKLGIPVCENCILKIKKNRKQAGLGRAARKRNVKGAYISNPKVVNNKHMLLVDDIMTTGSTLNECSNEMLLAGAIKVTRAVVAYTPSGRKR